jgi:GNAT superfamily N-acetyltransferase
MTLLDASFGSAAVQERRRPFDERYALGPAPFSPQRMLANNKRLEAGFVWEEQGRIIGNVSIVESSLFGRYLIANVAVDRAWRRRGIARALMNETMHYLERERAREVLLQVEDGNEPAIWLYRSLGFKALGTMRRWECSTSRLSPLPPGTGDMAEIRPLARSEWRSAYELDRISLAPNRNWPVPPSPDKYRTGLIRWLTDLVNGRAHETWVVAGTESAGGRLEGLASIWSEWGRPHSVELRVVPEASSRLSRPLLAKVFRRLAYLRGGTVQVIHPAEDEPAGDLLRQANFTLRRSLVIMMKQPVGLPGSLDK